MIRYDVEAPYLDLRPWKAGRYMFVADHEAIVFRLERRMKELQHRFDTLYIAASTTDTENDTKGTP